MKSILPILICIAMTVSFIIMPLCQGELPNKTLVILCLVGCHICVWRAVIACIYDDDRIEKLEHKIKELEEKNKNEKD